MRERVDLLNGGLTVKSEPDAGTTVTASLPAVHRASAAGNGTGPESELRSA
jgi:signal transduction histidine kinase